MSYAIKVENLSKQYRIRHGSSAGSLKEIVDNIKRKVFYKISKNSPYPAHNPYAVSYEEFWALNDVSFEIPKGAKLGVMGRNGAGKSTLLKILSRITEPTSGRISIQGVPRAFPFDC